MSEPRPTPRWVPILAVAALIALASLFLGPARVLRLAQKALPLERGYRDLPAAALGSMLRMAAAYLLSLALAWWAGVTAATRPAAARKPVAVAPKKFELPFPPLYLLIGAGVLLLVGGLFAFFHSSGSTKKEPPIRQVA